MIGKIGIRDFNIRNPPNGFKEVSFGIVKKGDLRWLPLNEKWINCSDIVGKSVDEFICIVRKKNKVTIS